MTELWVQGNGNTGRPHPDCIIVNDFSQELKIPTGVAPKSRKVLMPRSTSRLYSARAKSLASVRCRGGGHGGVHLVIAYSQPSVTLPAAAQDAMCMW